MVPVHCDETRDAAEAPLNEGPNTAVSLGGLGTRPPLFGNTRAEAGASPRIAAEAAASSARSRTLRGLSPLPRSPTALRPSRAERPEPMFGELRDAKRAVISDLQQEAIAARLGGAD
jgi:hypothetical protein